MDKTIHLNSPLEIAYPNSKMYGESDEGKWVVFNPDSAQSGVSYGPFPNRAETLAHLAMFSPECGKYAINMTDFPDWFKSEY